MKRRIYGCWKKILSVQDNIKSLYFYPRFDISGAFNTEDPHMQQLLIAGKRACPKLETLCSPMSVSRVFLPGKPCLKFISWTWAFYITEALDNMESHITGVSGELHSLQFLRYESSDGAGLPFVKIASYLNSLVILVISNDHLKEVSILIAHAYPSTICALSEIDAS